MHSWDWTQPVPFTQSCAAVEETAAQPSITCNVKWFYFKYNKRTSIPPWPQSQYGSDHE